MNFELYTCKGWKGDMYGNFPKKCKVTENYWIWFLRNSVSLSCLVLERHIKGRLWLLRKCGSCSCWFWGLFDAKQASWGRSPSFIDGFAGVAALNVAASLTQPEDGFFVVVEHGDVISHLFVCHDLVVVEHPDDFRRRLASNLAPKEDLWADLNLELSQIPNWLKLIDLQGQKSAHFICVIFRFFFSYNISDNSLPTHHW